MRLVTLLLRNMMLAFYPDWRIEKHYMRSACRVADVALGREEVFPLEMEKLIARWVIWERAYAKRGYYVFPFDLFVLYQKEKEEPAGLGKKREKGEGFVLHARAYESAYREIKEHKDISKISM